MSEDQIDIFRNQIERVIWKNSNLSAEERAEVLRQYAAGLEDDESRFEDMGEHVRRIDRETADLQEMYDKLYEKKHND